MEQENQKRERNSFLEKLSWIAAVIGVISSIYFYYDAKNSNGNRIVDVLSERYESVDKEMSYEQALEIVDREMVNLQNSNSILELNNVDLQHKVSELQNEISSYEQALEVADKEIEKLQNDNSVLTSENIDLKLKVDLLNEGGVTTWNENMVKVPYVIDMDKQKAEIILEEQGLVAQAYWLEGTDESSACYVVKQSIPTGSFVPLGTLIEIEISEVKLGTPVNVPKVVGMEQHEATTFLNKLGLRFQVWWTEENDIPSEHYYIIAQSIPAETSVPAGTEVRLEISPVQP